MRQQCRVCLDCWHEKSRSRPLFPGYGVFCGWVEMELGAFFAVKFFHWDLC